MLPRRINVLLVEENPTDADLVLQELERAGFYPDSQRVVSKNGYIGKLRETEKPYDLILLNHAVRAISAGEALDLLRIHQLDVPLIVLSGELQNGEAANCIQLGAADYVLKDRLARLGVAVTRILTEKQLQNDLRTVNGQLLSTYDYILHAWAYALELRDFETLVHTKRVRTLSLQLARYMGLRGKSLVQIGRGALLHDIGKLGIPDKILLKPGPLTQEERAIMQKHPIFAYLMLSPIDFLKPALEIPLSHHEKWDGTGYPDGLAGVDIPLAARIFAIVDVWDALNSSRPYRIDPWPREKITAYIRSESGKHFDPAVVEAFLRLIGSNESAQEM